MAEFNLLKLQLDDASFSADNFGSDGESADDESDSVGLLPFAVGLLFLLVVAVAAKKFLGDSDDPVDGLEPHDA